MIGRVVIAGLIALTLPGMAPAQAVSDKPQISLDPTKAYVFYRTGKSGAALRLIREPTPEETRDYQERSAKAFVDAGKRYARDLKRWEADVAAAKRDSGATIFKPGDRPVEPTERTFHYPPIALEMMLGIGPFNRFSKGEGGSTYLQELPPGDYTLYGPMIAGNQGQVVGTCACMGSVRFRADAGSITDLGRVTLPFVDAVTRPKSEGPRPEDELDLPEGVTSFAIQPPPAGTVPDPRIGAFPVRPAVYRAAAKIPNFYGITIDRITAIPGVIAYERDRIIDVASGAEVKAMGDEANSHPAKKALD